MHTVTIMPAPVQSTTSHAAPPPLAVVEPWHEHAWQQVLARDASADGSFVYAVRSTAIFCRPGCPSRRPTRSRVTFFRSPAEATRAGYRACLRCRPEQDARTQAATDARLVASAIAVLEQSGNDRVDLAALSRATGQPRAAILQAFLRTLGTTPARFVRERRRASFRRLLAPDAAAPLRITDAIYDAGFGSSSRLYEGSGAVLGMTPSALRAGAPGLLIRYVLAACPLGRVLVAATERGVCAISFADTDDALREELRSRFPHARLVAAASSPRAVADSPSSAEAAHVDAQDRAARDSISAWLATAVAFVLSHLAEHPAAAGFPLDVRATAFQQRVWQALCAIPRGQTTSYAALARQLGMPTGARAVAGACARNPVALAIPCHRVISGSGAMAGYRWGIERKRAILKTETRATQAPATQAPATQMDR